MRIAILCGLLCFAIGVGCYVHVMERRNGKDQSDAVIRLPKFYLYAAYAGLLAIVPLFGYMLAFPETFTKAPVEWWMHVVNLFFIGLGMSIILAYLNWRIVIAGKKFKYRTLFRNEYEYAFKDVYIRRITKNTAYIKAGKRTLNADLHTMGVAEFLGKVPKKKKPKH